MKINDFLTESADVDTIRKDCQPFLSSINYDPSLVPMKDIRNSLDYVDGDLSKIKTLERRTPIINSNKLVVDTLEYILQKNNIPSRVKNVVVASTKGYNMMFNLKPETTYFILPVGNFEYAYTKKDFNHLQIKSNMDRLFREIESLRDNFTLVYGVMISATDDKIIRKMMNENSDILNYETFKKALIDNINENIEYFKKLPENIAPEDVDLDKIQKEFIHNKTFNEKLNNIEMIIEILQKSINSIHANNYNDAFESENEIWFICDSFYIVKETEDLFDILGSNG